MATAKKSKAPKAVSVKSAAAPSEVRPVGRPSKWNAEIADLICEQLASGMTLNQVCKQDGMPDEKTVRNWALDDVNGFSPKYTRARELGYLKMADELIEIADTPVIGEKTVEKLTGFEVTRGDMIERARLKVDTRKWMLSKMLPKIYGDKIAVDHSGKVGMENAPVEELTGALNELLAKLK